MDRQIECSTQYSALRNWGSLYAMDDPSCQMFGSYVNNEQLSIVHYQDKIQDIGYTIQRLKTRSQVRALQSFLSAQTNTTLFISLSSFAHYSASRPLRDLSTTPLSLSLYKIPNYHSSPNLKNHMEETKPSKEPDPTSFDHIGSDLTELILSLLPIRSIVRAAAVCKPWRSIVTSAAFSRRVSATKKPWLFLYGQNNIFLKNNQAFAFDPESNEWIKLPTALIPLPTSQAWNRHPLLFLVIAYATPVILEIFYATCKMVSYVFLNSCVTREYSFLRSSHYIIKYFSPPCKKKFLQIN